jgi:hypothetical protein
MRETMPSAYMNEEDRKLMFRRIVNISVKGVIERVGIRLGYLSDKDKISLGEMVYRSIVQEKDVKLIRFNGLNIGYYHNLFKIKDSL